VVISPGKDRFPKSFEMGSPEGPAAEQPRHTITFSYTFAIAKYEVPQNLYEAVAGKNPSRWKGPRNSVEMVKWKDATQFCERLTVLLHEAGLIEKDELIRLPTEAEWEDCCRAGTTTAYSFGESATAAGDQENQASILNEYAWHTGNAAGNDPPVGALKPNPWDLYDMHGYLWEFVQDGWHENYQTAPTDGSAWLADGEDGPVVIRGGSWRDRHELLRSAARKSMPGGDATDAVGFRCVKARAPTKTR
jgi:formylglycine-generating enzyme required for sulfatase activity